MAAEVGMCPVPIDEISERMPPFQQDDRLSKDIWFYQPFHDHKNSLNPSNTVESMEDLFQNDLIDENMNQCSTPVSAFGEEIEVLPSPQSLLLSTVLSGNLDTPDSSADTANSDKTIIDPAVNIPGSNKKIYKSKLVNMPNDDPKLSDDRLTRVR